MRIDFQIPAHLRQQGGTDFLLAVLEGCEFLAQIDAAMTFLTLVSYKVAGGLPAPSQFPQPALEFRSLHLSRIGQFCPNVKRCSNPDVDGRATRPVLRARGVMVAKVNAEVLARLR